MEKATLHSDNAYKIPNLRVTGHVCKTNIPSNTAFRGFGGTQGMMMVEQWITDVALALGVSPVQVIMFDVYRVMTQIYMYYHTTCTCYFSRNSQKTQFLIHNILN